MKLLIGIYLFFARLVIYCYLGFGGYKLWSKIYRFLWERKWRDVELKTFTTIAEMAKFVGGPGHWRADSWRALWDSVSSPQRVQQIFAGIEPQPEHDLDCDDYMSFEAAVLHKSLKEGVLKEPDLAAVHCLTITWLEAGTVFGSGHNVTLLEYKDGLWGYIDYFLPSSRVMSREAVVTMVRNRYVGVGKWVGVAWMVSTPDTFTPTETHRG